MSASQPIEWTAAQLAQAVKRGQFELHYQPIVDLRSDQIVGAEALLRWRHPALGLLPPGQFLPVVETSGLMPEIGAWVLGVCAAERNETSTNFSDLSERVKIDFLGMANG
jgi:EAL domain-containing protein (putative c-di-GMP-specific phosphodiesterase class I)